MFLPGELCRVPPTPITSSQNSLLDFLYNKLWVEGLEFGQMDAFQHHGKLITRPIHNAQCTQHITLCRATMLSKRE